MSNKDEDAVNLFNKQASGKTPPQYSRGQITPEDEGDLAFAIAADPKRGVVRITFPKPVMWIAMEPEVALAFAASLVEKASEVEKAQKSSQK